MRGKDIVGLCVRTKAVACICADSNKLRETGIDNLLAIESERKRTVAAVELFCI